MGSGGEDKARSGLGCRQRGGDRQRLLGGREDVGGCWGGGRERSEDGVGGVWSGDGGPSGGGAGPCGDAEVRVSVTNVSALAGVQEAGGGVVDSVG